MLFMGGKVGMLAEGGSLDGFQLGKCFAELSEEFIPFLFDKLFGSVVVRSQEDVTVGENFRIVPSSSAKQCVAQWISTGKEEGGWEPEGRDRVSGDVAADST
jgi:hypothetical protein